MTTEGLAGLEAMLGPQTPAAVVALEACREAWAVERKLREWGHRPVVVDTTRSRQMGIGQHRRKTDRIDAEVLARAVEKGSIPVAHVLSPHRQQLRLQLGVRRALVETRASYVTTIRGLVRSQGERLPSCAVECFVRVLRESELKPATRQLVEPLASLLEPLNEQIEQAERVLESLCAQEPVILKLKTVPGVATIVAAAFVSVIDEAGRFRHAHQVESYVGLVPSEDSSGTRRLGSITKQGNRYLRALLMQAAWSVLRQADDENPLRRWGHGIQARRGKRIAVVAVARRLVGILWALWRDGTVYEPWRLGLASASGLARQAQDLQVQADALKRAARKSRARRPRRASAEVKQMR